MNVDPQLDVETPEHWIGRHGDYLFRYALARVRRTDIAEDLVQETFLAAWRGREKFAGRSTLRTWLVGILKRKLIDRLRRGTAEILAGDVPSADASTDELFDRRGRWRRPPSEWAVERPETPGHRREFWEVVSACVNRLPARLRIAFVQRHLDDQSPEAVCRDLGVSSSNFWVMLHRARLRLHECMDRKWFGGDA